MNMLGKVSMKLWVNGGIGQRVKLVAVASEHQVTREQAIEFRNQFMEANPDLRRADLLCEWVPDKEYL